MARNISQLVHQKVLDHLEQAFLILKSSNHGGIDDLTLVGSDLHTSPQVILMCIQGSVHYRNINTEGEFRFSPFLFCK